MRVPTPMSLRFPGFEKQSAWYLFNEVGSHSGYVNIFIDDSDKESFRYCVSLHEPHTRPHEVFETLSVSGFDEAKALHRLTMKMVTTAERMESGELEGQVKITAKSKKFVYEMSMTSLRSLTAERTEDGSYKLVNPKKNSPHANSISVSVKLGRKKITVGHIHFHAGINSGFLLAHDLSVLMALVEGKPPLEIIKMKPKKAIDPFTDDERSAVHNASNSRIDWNALQQQADGGKAYVNKLKQLSESEINTSTKS